MESEFREPTRAGRIKLVLLVVVCTAMWIFMNFYWKSVMSPRMEGPICESLPWVQRVAIGWLLVFLFASLGLARAAWLTLASGETPFPGAWVLVRKPIKRGRQARTAGVLLAVQAVVILGFMVWIWQYFNLAMIFCLTGECPPC